MKPLQARVNNIAAREDVRTRVRGDLVVITITSRLHTTTGKFRHGMPVLPRSFVLCGVVRRFGSSELMKGYILEPICAKAIVGRALSS
jgi:hypothetical protein